MAPKRVVQGKRVFVVQGWAIGTCRPRAGATVVHYAVVSLRSHEVINLYPAVLTHLKRFLHTKLHIKLKSGYTTIGKKCRSGFYILILPFQAPAWKEIIARKLLLSIRTAACAIREVGCKASPGHSESPFRTTSPSVDAVGCLDEDLTDIVADAVAASAVIAGSSGVLYPGAVVQVK